MTKGCGISFANPPGLASPICAVSGGAGMMDLLWERQPDSQIWLLLRVLCLLLRTPGNGARMVGDRTDPLPRSRLANGGRV